MMIDRILWYPDADFLITSSVRFIFAGDSSVIFSIFSTLSELMGIDNMAF